MANEPAAAPAAPVVPANTDTAVAAPAAPAAAPAAGSTAPAAGAPPATPESTPPAAAPAAPAPSLLAGADAGKREGAPADAAKAPPAEPAKPADPASAAKPADGTPPPDGAKEPPKPAEPPKPEPGKDGEPKAPDAAAKDALAPEPPAPPPVYGDLKLPEGFKLEDGKLKQFDSLLGTFETTAKAEHGQVEALRQSLVDFYQTEVQRIGEQVSKHQVDVWNRMKEGWINELKSDPRLGGNRIDTTLGNAKYAYENMLGLEKQQQDGLMAVLDNAGVSSHPLLIRALHNLYERFREPESIPSNPMVPPARGKEPGQRGWYSAVDGVNLPQTG